MMLGGLQSYAQTSTQTLTAPSSFPTNASKQAMIVAEWNRLWASGLPELHLRDNLEANNSLALYNFQLNTHALLMFLDTANTTLSSTRQMIRQLAYYYSIPFENRYLKKAWDANNVEVEGTWVCGEFPATIPVRSLAQPCPAASVTPGQLRENLLYSVQFAYGAAKVMALISKIPASERTGPAYEVANSMLTVNGPKLISMYQRWLKGRVSKTILGNIGMNDVARMDINGQKYTLLEAPLTDQAMQLMGGILELQRAQYLSPTEVRYARPQEIESYRLHFSTLFNDPNRMRRFSDGRVVFDPKWKSVFSRDGYQACYWIDSLTAPTSSSICKAAEDKELTTSGHGTVTYDIGHYQRIIYLLDSMIQYPETFDSTLSSKARSTIYGHIKQMRLAVANWDGQGVFPTQPIKFKNYFGSDRTGTAPNGWFRLVKNTITNSTEITKTANSKGPFELTEAGKPYMLWSKYSLEFATLAKKYFIDHPVLLTPPSRLIQYSVNSLAMIPVLPESGSMSIHLNSNQCSSTGATIALESLDFYSSQVLCDQNIKLNSQKLVICCYNGSKYRSSEVNVGP